MIKSLVVACLTTAAALGAGAAHAAHVSWSIGINTPVVGTVVSNGPAYAPVYAPVYERSYEPVYAPVRRYAPVPEYVPAPRVAYYPRSDVYYGLVPVVVPRYDYRGWNRGRWYHDHVRWADHGRR